MRAVIQKMPQTRKQRKKEKQRTYLGITNILLLQVQLKCVQTLLSIFGHKNESVAGPYIHAMTPLLMERLKTYRRDPKREDIPEGMRKRDEEQLPIVIEAEKCLEILAAKSTEEKSKGLLYLSSYANFFFV